MSSVVEKDFIERLIRQIAEFVAKAAGLAQKNKPDEAIEVLQSACPTLLGVEWAPLAAVDSASAASILHDALKMRMFGALLIEMANIHEQHGDPALAVSKRQHALEIFIEAQLRKRDLDTDRQLMALEDQIDVELLAPKYRQYVDAL